MSGDTPKGRIIGCRKDGLGARLLVMLNCIKLGHQFDAPFHMYWPRKGSRATGMEHPEHLFSPAMLEQHFLTYKAYSKALTSAVPLWKFLSDTGPERLEAHLRSGGDVHVDEGFEIVLFPWEDDESVRGTYPRLFDQIGLIAPLREKCVAVDTALAAGGAGSLAYHLRRGDILNAAPWKHTVWLSKVVPDEYYEAHLQKSPDKAALVFSDSPASIVWLKEKFPNLIAINDIVPLDTLETLQRDFLELYAMSRADEIIAPRLSAFSTAAARISGRHRTQFMQVLTDDEFDAAHASAVDRLLKRPESFATPSDAAHAFAGCAKYLAHPERFQAAIDILTQLKVIGADNAFIDIHLAVSHLYLEQWTMAAQHARNAALLPDLWPGDFAAAKAIEAVAYGATGQNRKAGNTFREAFLFKPQRQEVILAGTNLLMKFQLNKNNFVPFDQQFLRHMHMTAAEDRAGSYVDGKIINNNLRRDFRFVMLDWPGLVIDGKAARLKEDKTELSRMLARMEQLDDARVAEILPIYQSTKGQILAYLSDPQSRELLEAAVKAEPDNLLNLMRLANVLLLEKDRQGALNLLDQTCKLAPQNPFYAHTYGMALLTAGKQDQAAEVLTLAADSENATAKVQADFAKLAVRIGQHDKAEAALRKAAQAIPVLGKYRKQLQRLTDHV